MPPLSASWEHDAFMPLQIEVRGDCSLSLGGFGDDNTGHARERRAFAFTPTGLPEPVVGFLLTVGLPFAGHHQKLPDMRAAAGGSVCVGFIQTSTDSSRLPLSAIARIFRMSSRLWGAESTWTVFATSKTSWPAGSGVLNISPSTIPMREPSGSADSRCRATAQAPGSSNNVPRRAG